MSNRFSLLEPVLICVVVLGFQSPIPALAQDISILQRQAKAGNAEAQYKLSEAYYSGTMVALDPQLGYTWLRKSADQGYAKAEYALAYKYEHSQPKDEVQAQHWYLRAADHGDAKSQTMMGLDYKYGESGVARDAHEAARWFRRAARQNEDEARSSLSEMRDAGLISAKEADWTEPELGAAANKTPKPKPFSLAEVEMGLQGGIANKRMVRLIQEFGVNFTLAANAKQRLANAGADDNLLSSISASRR